MTRARVLIRGWHQCRTACLGAAEAAPSEPAPGQKPSPPLAVTSMTTKATCSKPL